MKLQGRDLSIKMQGEDVKLLHTELRQIGYTIPDEEVQQSVFGKGTRQVVLEFQKAERLETTGIVDEKTADRINAKVDAQKPEKYLVRGHVTQSNETTTTAFSGATVRAYDWDRNNRNFLGETTTNENGYYEITYTDDQFRRSDSERGGADLIVCVLNNEGQVLATSKRKNNAQAEETVDLTVQVIEPIPQDDKFVVKGTIHQADNSVFVGAIVRAFDKDLRREQLLGEKISDRDGYYEITYTRAQFSRSEKNSADLIVRVYERTGDRLLAQSDIIFNAKPIEIVDLTVIREEDRTRSEYERLMAALRPLLGEQAITELREDAQENPEEEKYRDLTFLSGETGFTKNILARLVLAHKLAQQAIQPEFWFALLGGSFYQYNETQNFDEQLAAILDSLPSLDATTVRKALTRSFNQKEISEALRENIDRWIEAFLQFIANLIISQTDRPTFVNLALQDAGIQNIEKQIKFAGLFNQYKALTPELLAALEQDESFTQPEIGDLRTSFQLADLSRGDFSVVKVIKEEFSVRQPEQIRTLAKRSESQWVNLITTKHAAGEITLPIQVNAIAGQVQLPEAEVYGKMLDRQFREAFPTTAFTGGLERALQNGGSHGLQQAEALGRFLDRHETFELLNTSVDDFLKNHVQPDFREVADNENFRLEVKAVQRVFKLAPTFEATDALLADDLHSAQKVYRMGESEFVRQYGDRPGFTPETAQLAWNRAADTHAAVLTIVADLKALETEALPLALQNNNADLSTFPNWNNLFKTGDLCECEHCRSVLSPAAYFADLLMFLKDRKSTKPPKKPGDPIPSIKDILFDRRLALGNNRVDNRAEFDILFLSNVGNGLASLEVSLEGSYIFAQCCGDDIKHTITTLTEAGAIARLLVKGTGKQSIQIGLE